jgi:hypothetical protein
MIYSIKAVHFFSKINIQSKQLKLFWKRQVSSYPAVNYLNLAYIYSNWFYSIHKVKIRI